MRSVRRSLLTGLAGALVAFGCADHTTSPGPIRPLSQTRDISDGSHNAGNPHFFFLPPMVSHPTYSGASDGSQTPVVRVCDWQTTANGAACGPIVANFTTDGGTDGQVVSYDGTSQYGVNWHTNVCVTGPCTLDPTKTYRVRVLVGSQELGHADVQVVSNGSQLKNVQTGDYIGLVDGRTLPVKFRIEQGAIIVVKAGVPAPITPAGGTVGSADGQTSVMIPAGALAATAPIAIGAAPAAPAGGGAWTAPVDLEPTGTTFATPAALTLSFDPTQLPAGVPPSAMGIFTVDANGGWAAVPNSAVNLVDNTVTAPISHFSYYTVGIHANVAQATGGDVYIGVNQQFTFASWSIEYQTNTGQTCYWTYNPFPWYNCYDNPAIHYPAVNQTVQWQSNSNVATFRTAYSVTDAFGDATSPIMDTHLYGDAVVTAALFGASTTSTVHVEPHLRWNSESIKLSLWQKMSDALSIDYTIGLPYTISLAYLNPGVVFGTDAVALPVGVLTTPNPPYLTAGATGVATVRASIPGYLTDDLTVSVGGLGNLLVQGPTAVALGGTGAVSLQTLSPDNATPAGPASDEIFALSGNNVSFSDGVNPITSVKVPALSTSPASFVVRGTAAGQATITLTNSHYNTGTFQLTVPAPATPPGVPLHSTCTNNALSGIAFDGSYYYVGEGTANAPQCISRYDALGHFVDSRTVPVYVRGLTYVPSTGKLVVRTANGPFYQVDYASGNTQQLTSFGLGAQSQEAADPDGVTYWSLNAQTSTAERHRFSDNGLVFSFPVTGGSPVSPAIAVSNTFVLLPNGPFVNRYYKNTGAFENSHGVSYTTSGCTGGLYYYFRGTFGFGASADDRFVMYDVTCDAAWVDALGNGAAGAVSLTQVSAGNGHTCASTQTGLPTCWGANASFQLGTGSTANSLTPVVTAGGIVYNTDPVVVPLQSLSAGEGFTCGLYIGVGYCWGRNDYGQLGNGGTTPSATPLNVLQGDFTSIAAGTYHACGIKRDGSAWCWGWNLYGELGNDVAGPPSTPVQVIAPPGVTFTQIGVEELTTCALSSTGQAYCWGNNYDGRLGNGGSDQYGLPLLVTMPAGVTFTSLSVGRDHACAIGNDNTAYCWGSGNYGEIGIGVGGAARVPTAVLSPSGGSGSGLFVAVSAGVNHTCAIASSALGGGAYCWGANSTGQLGTGNTNASWLPAQVVNGGSFVAVSANDHSCALDGSSKVFCWGDNSSGAIGTGSQQATYTSPVAVAGQGNAGVGMNRLRPPLGLAPASTLQRKPAPSPAKPKKP